MRLLGAADVIPSIRVIPVWPLLVVGLFSFGPVDGYECGGFIGMASSSTGTIQSPSYPGNYPNYTRCIWMLQAPEQYTTQLVVNFVGEMYSSSCSDYVEFRDGGQAGDIIKTNCATMNSETVSSTGRWMYVFFSTDGFSQQTGLSATYSAIHVGCRSYEFECSNKLCLSMSYRCDGYYDCGCGADCDEDGCGGLSIDKPTRMGIGFAVGITVFFGVAAVGLLLEKRRHWEKDRSQQQAKTEPLSRRQGWTSKKNANVGVDSSQPKSPTVKPACTIKVSEVV